MQNRLLKQERVGQNKTKQQGFLLNKIYIQTIKPGCNLCRSLKHPQTSENGALAKFWPNFENLRF